VHLFLQRCPPSPSGYTPRGLTSGQRREARYGFSCFITTSKQTKKARCDRSITVDKLVITQICECIDEDLQSITQISTWMEKNWCMHLLCVCLVTGWARSHDVLLSTAHVPFVLGSSDDSFDVFPSVSFQLYVPFANSLWTNLFNQKYPSGKKNGSNFG